jgi:hypothetical protein
MDERYPQEISKITWTAMDQEASLLHKTKQNPMSFIRLDRAIKLPEPQLLYDSIMVVFHFFLC